MIYFLQAAGRCLPGSRVKDMDRKNSRNISRTEHSVQNVKYALAFQAVFFILQFLLRRVFVRTLSSAYLGLNGTYTNLISLLSVAELGVGGTISFSLYKPVADKDEERIAALVGLYRRVCAWIGVAVAVFGLALLPFLPRFIGDLALFPDHRLYYLLFLAESVSSYYLLYRQVLIGADQRQYIITFYQYAVLILITLLQMLFLVRTGNYLVFLCLRIAGAVTANALLFRKAGRLYPFLIKYKNARPDKATEKEIVKNTKAMAAHKLGGVAVNGTDNILIAAFAGIVNVGKYSNYLMVINGLNTLYDLIFRSLLGSIGNLGATESSENIARVFKRVNFMGEWLYGVSSVCLAVLFQPFIRLWVGEEFLFSLPLVLLISTNFYVSGMRKAVLTFRDPLGLFWYDRYKPLAEALINLAVSVVLAVRFGIAGILLGTLISTLATCFWIEPYVLYRYGLKNALPLSGYFAEYLKNTLITVTAGLAVQALCSLIPERGVLFFILRMGACFIAANLIFLLFYGRREEFRYYRGLLAALLRRNKGGEKAGS